MVYYKNIGVSALVAVALMVGHAPHVQAADAKNVRAASQAFYSALSVLDDGSAMENVWAKTPYVTFVGPRSRSIIVGWKAQKNYWMKANKRFSRRHVLLTEQHLHVNGHFAWEVGIETADVKLTNGSVQKTTNIVTNVFEQINGRWLMVSHQAQPMPH